jgi:opacity protein-like surface antigen
MRRHLLAAACLMLVAGTLGAQDTTLVVDETAVNETGPRPFTVTPSVGVQMYDTHSGFRRSSVVAAIDLTYRLGSMLGVGLTASAGRPETDETYFPLVRQSAGDTSLFHRVSQRVEEYTVGVRATGSMPLGRLLPYVAVGAGVYSFTMDPQAVGTTKRTSGPMFSLGGGINVPFGERAGITLDLRDVVFSSFDRDDLDATDPLFRDDRFDPIPAGKPGPKSSIHNIRFSVGVSFVPGSKEAAQ